MKTRRFVSMTCGVSTALLLVVSGCNKKTEPEKVGVAAAAATVAEPAPAAAMPELKGFEGDLTVRVHATKPSTRDITLTVTVKAPKVRVELPQGLGDDNPQFKGGGYALMDTSSKQLTMVMDAQKQAMVLDINDLTKWTKQFGAKHDVAGDKEAPPTVTKTGHKDTVNGFSCEDWDIVSPKGEKSKICVTDGDVSWFQIPGEAFTGEQSWAKELADGHHLPVRAISFDSTGAELSRAELLKIEKKPVADTVFEIPASYRKVEVSNMLRGLAGLGAFGSASAGAPAGLPPGMQLPPGVQLPANMQLPPNMKIPPEAAAMMQQMQERAKAAAAAAAAKKP